MAKVSQEPLVTPRLSDGYVQTIQVTEPTDVMTNAGIYSTIGTEIDSTLFAYNQIMAGFYMNNYVTSNYGENPSINIPPSNHVHGTHLAVYGQLWKLSYKLTELHKEFYRYLNSTVTVRVYNNEPILLSTPSRSGYIVIHPSIQDLETGNDEYGIYYEANLGGVDNLCACINGAMLQARHMHMLRR